MLRVACLAWLAAAGAAQAAVGYIAAPSGLLLHADGDEAVLVYWNQQSPIQGFSGYGRVYH